MRKLGQVGVLAMALVVGYVARGASGCGSANAESEAKCDCPAGLTIDVAEEPCVDGEAVHLYPGKKALQLAATTVVLVGGFGKPERFDGGIPFVLGDGKVTVSCLSSATSAIFSLPVKAP